MCQYLITVFALLQGRKCDARPPGRDAVLRRLVTSHPADATPAGGLRPSRLQALWLEEEPEPRVEQPEHDGGQRNHVSVLRLRGEGRVCSTRGQEVSNTECPLDLVPEQMTAVLHRKPLSAGIFSDSCRTQGHDKRYTL